MLESVLADVLTRLLGQYLEGIDRDSVHVGAWSGLVELRGVALRPDALAVLFETLGLHLPVTVEAGFIGLLRLHVPWKSIGTTPVRIEMDDISVMARPVRGDGSDDSDLELRERRIKRAKLDTDDAVREASWGVTADTPASSSWGAWLVSDDLRANIIDNVQIHLRDINLRFEDPFSDPRRPYIASVACKSLKAISANHSWQEAFVKHISGQDTRKLLQVEGFRINWAPITPRDTPGMSRGTAQQEGASAKRFETAEILKNFMKETDTSPQEGISSVSAFKSILHPVDGSLRLRLTGAPADTTGADADNPPVDLDIRFPDVQIDLDDVQYACLLQTSVYFARLATRGHRPSSPKGRWVWAIDQLLPGFSMRRARALRFTEKGIAESRDKRVLYIAYWKSLLKARRTGIEEPKQIAQQLMDMEDQTSYEEILAYRDFADRQIELEGEEWKPAQSSAPVQSESSGAGTTTSSFWTMLGYSEEATSEENSAGLATPIIQASTVEQDRGSGKRSTESGGQADETAVYLRVAFVLRSASVRLSEKGFPDGSVPRVSLQLRDLRMGMLYSASGELSVEAVLGSIEAWDIRNRTRMVYGRQGAISDSLYDDLVSSEVSSYPRDVSEAIEAIRCGSNPAKELLLEDDEDSGDEDSMHIPGDGYFKPHEQAIEDAFDTDSGSHSSRRSRSRVRGSSMNRDPSPTSTFRVTEAEFLGNPKSVPGTVKHIAAFRYTYKLAEGSQGSKKSFSSLDVSIATLEAIVDGPKGTFLWGLKFWQPKGMAQDPIMAFLGAAAGARIAELRMELEQSLLGHTVPLQINAVILAPRFILPSRTESAPAIVINMGTLGICTSDNSPLVEVADPRREKALIRYANYVLTLDDLGMYYSPNLTTALSQSLRASLDEDSLGGFAFGAPEQRYLDTTHVERIIRPFSLRFILQTLRDASVAQVAHAPRGENAEPSDRLAKVKVRGNIPGLALVLTQTAFQHLMVTSHRWSRGVQPSNAASLSSFPMDTAGWQPARPEEKSPTVTQVSVENLGLRSDGSSVANATTSEHPTLATAMASYDVKLMIRKVSVELQDSRDVRLVTAVASRMAANIVKTGQVNLQADFSLQSWSVTDGSRGSTAAFRRLIYAGTFDGSKGVSPPRSLTGTGDWNLRSADENRNFVNVRYTRDFAANEQKVHFRFLSLNMVCVRETYIRLASFFYGVRKYAQRFRQASSGQKDVDESLSSIDGLPTPSSDDVQPSFGTQAVDIASNLNRRRTEVSAEFDGFNFQLVASGGAIAVIEMQDSTIRFVQDEESNMNAWGDFRFFSVRDLTAPIAEHIGVVTYEKPAESSEDMGGNSADHDSLKRQQKDQWTLSLPTSTDDIYKLHARFKGIKLSFLYRFSEVIQQYVSVLLNGIKPALDMVREDIASQLVLEGQQGIAPAFEKEAGRFQVELDLDGLSVRLPRHSGCASEALEISLSSVRIGNYPTAFDQKEWRIELEGVDFAVDYILPAGDDFQEKRTVSSRFLEDLKANMIIGAGGGHGVDESGGAASSTILVQLNLREELFMQFCEAQYTVLYFVLTENFLETVDGLEIPMGLNDLGMLTIGAEGFPDNIDENLTDAAENGGEDVTSRIVATEIDSNTDTFDGKQETILDVNITIPGVRIELSRGWDVSKTVCKVLGMTMQDLEIDMKLSTPRQLLVELTGHLLSLSDMRPEAHDGSEAFMVPLSRRDYLVDAPLEIEDASNENVTFTFEKEAGCRPSLFLFLSGFQLQAAPELLRDLMFLAIPGWPYLESSPFAPDIVYLGRVVNIVLSDSQVVVLAEEDCNDRRALVFTGEFQTKVEWMKDTAAKRISLRASRAEISTSSHFPNLVHVNGDRGQIHLAALPYERDGSPLMYPTNSFMEYSASDVDERGRYLDVSLESILCLVNMKEIPLLRAVFRRVSRMRQSYLLNRDWTQAAQLPDSSSGVTELTAKQKQEKQARKSMSVSIQTQTARYLITDEGGGRFVPVLELYFKGFGVQANMPSMVQIESEVYMNLYNSEKGWWEPAIEPWHVAASMSHGQSGTRAIVVRSEQRLNINITPTTISAGKTVAKSFQSAAKMGTISESVDCATHRISHLSGKRQHLDASKSGRQPSVAAFLVRNELGVPVAMSLPGSSKRTTIAHDSNIEVGMQTEELLSSPVDGENGSRRNALRCSLSIPSYAPHVVSAAEVGRHYVTFQPNVDDSSREDLAEVKTMDLTPVKVVWEVQMNNGVPVCTIRSLFRVVNETDTVLELRVGSNAEQTVAPTDDIASQGIRITPGGYFALPLHDIRRSVRVRPDISGSVHHRSAADSENIQGPTDVNDLNLASTSNYAFDWSVPLPSVSWLGSKAQVAQRSMNSSTGGGASKLQKAKSQTGGTTGRTSTLMVGQQILKCKTRLGESSDFFLTIVPIVEDTAGSPQDREQLPWLDICLKAPIVLENKLPGPLSYRITQRFTIASSSRQSRLEFDNDGAVLAAGVLKALTVSHLHFSGESMDTSFLALAYDNAPTTERLEGQRISSSFGPAINFEALSRGKPKAVLLSPEDVRDGKGNTRREFRAKVTPPESIVARFVVSAGFWIRNRSDTAVEICSRGSYYAPGSRLLRLRARPPKEDPDEFVCLEGPYLSIRIPREASRSSEETVDHSEWWTTPSQLDDIQKPLNVSLSGRSLELELRPATGLGNSTSVITIRNSSWIVNSTCSPMQWCQTSALDAHGNCRTRMVSTIQAGDAQGIHWDGKSSHKAVHLRLCESDGQSDWIWSPAIPLDIGHSRELPAKMYRPKSQEQYIARVASKILAGDSRALVIFSEDRQNPPYRIVNLCKERAVAFSQINTQERPWLLRAGKVTRYSWDDPLAPPNSRQLSMRILEKEDLVLGKSRDNTSHGSERDGASQHAKCTLNIDVVGDRVMVLSQSYYPTVVVSVSVDGATKIVTFCDEDENGKLLIDDHAHVAAASSSQPSGGGDEQRSSGDAVPVVGWDEISQRESGKSWSGTEEMSEMNTDYPLTSFEARELHARRRKGEAVDTDAAVFLDSIGISIVTSEPSELMYIRSQRVLINYEAYDKLQCVSLHIEDFQIDNQLPTPPYPVMMWVSTEMPKRSAGVGEAEAGGGSGSGGENAIDVEIHRTVTDDDIMMIKSFQMAILPFCLSIDDELISQVLGFISDTALDGKSGGVEALSGVDEEHVRFGVLLDGGVETLDASNRDISGGKKDHRVSSRRIYVDEFKVSDTSLRFTSVGSGAALVKAAGIMPSARALVALVLNVENCQFELPALNVRNVFDSLHHFAILVREYYVTQLNNQRMKLLASNALMGNPAALFDTVGTGARDFFAEPGRAKGSADFVASVGRGSKSLLTHTVGGIVESVSSIPRAVSTGLERAVGDHAYLAERERIRGAQLTGGHRGAASSSAASGLATGALSFAHGISSGVSGLIREPVHGARTGGAGGLLKGIGKAFIGGVAKPVAGAIDLVAEPAAGLSRGMADGAHELVAPVRPPRAFPPPARRLQRYDARAATGAALLSAVQLTCGVVFPGRLLAWVELSDRPGRDDALAHAWAWGVLQRHCRAMPGATRALRTQMRRTRRGELREEKTRVALVLSRDIVVGTLDGRLVTAVALWHDARHELSRDGKDVVVRSSMAATQTAASAGLAAGGGGGFLAAPWDANAGARTRRPAAGDVVVERVACGGLQARDELFDRVLWALRARADDGGERGLGVELGRLEGAGVAVGAGGAGREMDVRGRGGGWGPGVGVGGAREGEEDGDGEGDGEVDGEEAVALAQLVEIGFEREMALRALREAGGDLVRAVDVLTR